jgi:hypothetical protein
MNLLIAFTKYFDIVAFKGVLKSDIISSCNLNINGISSWILDKSWISSWILDKSWISSWILDIKF